MSKTSNPKQITKIVIDEANGLTHVYMSDLSPKIVKANTTAPTNIPTKNEFSFRDESVESSEVVDKAFDEAFPEEEQPPLFCPICGGLLREARRGNYVFVECMSCELAVLGDDSDDYEEAKENAWLTARQFLSVGYLWANRTNCKYHCRVPLHSSRTSALCPLSYLRMDCRMVSLYCCI